MLSRMIAKRRNIWVLAILSIAVSLITFLLIQNERNTSNHHIIKLRKNSVQQLVKLLAVHVQVYDKPSIHRIIKNSMIPDFANKIQITRIDGEKIYQNNQNGCPNPEIFPIQYLGSKIASIDVCMKEIDNEFVSLTLMVSIFLGFFSLFGIVFILINYIMNKDTKKFLSFLEELEWKSKSASTKSQYNFEADVRLSQLHSKIQDLITKLKESAAKEKEAQTAMAVARTTQMVAHDVRKPFAMLKSSLFILKHCSDIGQFRKNVSKIENRLDRSISQVEGLMEDIMLIDAKPILLRKSISPIKVIQDSIEDFLTIFNQKDKLISVAFNHRSEIKVDSRKTQRVFVNLLANAHQAMEDDGKIYIETFEQPTQIEFVVKNTKSYIDESSIPFLFEAFYTKGKTNGTGLGLAIVKKIVDIHGGTIKVSSNKTTQSVEFRFTLPKSKGLDDLAHNHNQLSNKSSLRSSIKTVF